MIKQFCSPWLRVQANLAWTWLASTQGPEKLSGLILKSNCQWRLAFKKDWVLPSYSQSTMAQSSYSTGDKSREKSLTGFTSFSILPIPGWGWEVWCSPEQAMSLFQYKACRARRSNWYLIKKLNWPYLPTPSSSYIAIQPTSQIFQKFLPISLYI